MGKPPESPADIGVPGNPTASDSSDGTRRIRKDESDGLAARIREVVGDESVRAFARRAVIPEATLRNMMSDGDSNPRVDNVLAVAQAGSVTVDWLLTGRYPKFKCDVGHHPHLVGQPLPLLEDVMPHPNVMVAEEPHYREGLLPDEETLLSNYRSAGDVGRHALRKVANAIAGRSLRAWFDAGVAVSEAAGALDREK